MVNPFGVMYNPASVFHSVERLAEQRGDTQEPSFSVVFLTLGTNHIYRLKETGEIVDNCQKRPQALFEEEELSVDECADYLMKAIDLLCQMNADMHIVLTVSPIRYRKYSYHGSQLSKATLLLAVEKVIREQGNLFEFLQTAFGQDRSFSHDGDSFHSKRNTLLPLPVQGVSGSSEDEVHYTFFPLNCQRLGGFLTSSADQVRSSADRRQ